MAEACYQDRYLPGSFKGVPFHVERAGSEHGRRGAEGEFPFGETTAYADLGRRIRTYTLTARFQTNNHVLEAAALIAACEATGPGVLVHPTRGVILSAACRSLKVTDDVEDEGGVTRVDMTFVEANNWPNGLSLVGQLLGLVVSTIIGSARTHFTSMYSPSTAQPFRRTAVLDAAQEQVNNIRGQYLNNTSDITTDKNRNRTANDLARLVNNEGMAADASIMDRGLALGMQAVAINTEGQDKYDVFRSLANGAAKTSSFASPAADSENALYSTVRIIAAAYMAEGALEAPQARTGIIYDQIDTITELLEQEIEYARGICDNPLFMELRKFRDEVQTQLYEKAYNAPGLVEFNFGGGVHALTAAYSIYGDAKRHRELEAVNPLGSGGRIDNTVLASLGGAS